jgi:hypothetical protein
MYFLRLQVLREIATGVKQRIGLEPWGRLRIEYLGLTPDLPFIQTWAPRLGVERRSAREGVAALLDHHRRLRMLHDGRRASSRRMWNERRQGDPVRVPPEAAGWAEGHEAVARGRRTSRPHRPVVRHPADAGVERGEVLGRARGQRARTSSTGCGRSLQELKLLVPVTLTGWNKPLKGSSGRTRSMPRSSRSTPPRPVALREVPAHHHPASARPGLCMAWRCGGRWSWEDRAPDDFDLHVLDGDYAMLRAAEHSAQVPHDA